jgi:hypothetical protein
VQLNIDEQVASQRQQPMFFRFKEMSSWIYILLYTCSSDITIIIIIVRRKAHKVVVRILVSASFSFFLLICYVRSFTKENRQARKYNRVVEDDKIILIDSHCRCRRCRHRIIRIAGVFFNELVKERIGWWIKAICFFFCVLR